MQKIWTSEQILSKSINTFAVKFILPYAENFVVANLVNRKPFANSFIESVLAKHGAYQNFPTYGISRA